MERYTKEQHWELRYISQKTGEEKVCEICSEERKQQSLDYCREHGIRVLSCRKLYPFSTMKRQHKFDLIHSICYCAMHDMLSGEKPYDEAKYKRLYDMDQKAQEFFGLPLPIAWLPWEDWQAAKELSNKAIVYHQDACIANGRPDLVAACVDDDDEPEDSVTDKEKWCELVRTMDQLGYPTSAYLTVKPEESDRWIVYWESQYLGIYDFTRHTFVD